MLGWTQRPLRIFRRPPWQTGRLRRSGRGQCGLQEASLHHHSRRRRLQRAAAPRAMPVLLGRHRREIPHSNPVLADPQSGHCHPAQTPLVAAPPTKAASQAGMLCDQRSRLSHQSRGVAGRIVGYEASPLQVRIGQRCVVWRTTQPALPRDVPLPQRRACRHQSLRWMSSET